jgi:hypothetical protein
MRHRQKHSYFEIAVKSERSELKITADACIGYTEGYATDYVWVTTVKVVLKGLACVSPQSLQFLFSHLYHCLSITVNLRVYKFATQTTY